MLKEIILESFVEKFKARNCDVGTTFEGCQTIKMVDGFPAVVQDVDGARIIFSKSENSLALEIGM